MPGLKTIHPGRPLQLGFIGGGLSSAIGPAHFSACRLDGRWELVAGSFSRRGEINMATAEAWHISKDRVYQSWQGMVTDEIEKLDSCQRVVGSSLYCRFYEKNERNKWQDISLNFSSL